MITEERRQDEQIAIRISDVLSKNCPAFEREGERTTCEWHRCYCRAYGSACVCVWHITDTCRRGEWKILDFVRDYNHEKELKRTHAGYAADEALNRTNQEDEKNRCDRFELLDIE